MQGIDLGLIDVETQHGKAGAMKRGQERQPDVTEADDADLRFVRFDFLQQIHRGQSYRLPDSAGKTGHFSMFKTASSR